MSFPSQKSTVVAQPLIAVRDVRASSRWYAKLLGADPLAEHSHRDVYDRIACSGQLVLQLHAWDAEHHPNLVNADAAPPGHGVLLWFEVDDFDSVLERARALRAEIIEEPHINPAPHTGKFGCAIPTVTWWWLPVRMANAVRNRGAAAPLRLASLRPAARNRNLRLELFSRVDPARGLLMKREEEYRARAAECEYRAEQVEDATVRAEFRDMAKQWRQMAAQIEELEARRGKD